MIIIDFDLATIVTLRYAGRRAITPNMTTFPESWKLSLPCTRKEAESLDIDDPRLAEMDEPPTIVTQEIDPAHPEKWEILAYFDGKPTTNQINMVRLLVPSAQQEAAVLERIENADWVTLSQQAIAPVFAGRFFVHTSTNAHEQPSGSVSFLIEASRAFGTGGHETTSGCLKMLDSLRHSGARFDNVVDIGTGTGLLAFAARHLWPRAYVTASDIDPVSIEVSIDNAAVNGVPVGPHPGQVSLCVASGTDHEMIQRRAPYDLVIANILAGPLIELAPALSDILEEGGTLVLAGLLDRQVADVRRAYWREGLRFIEQTGGEWPCLRLAKRRRFGWRRPARPRLTTSQPPGDFGTW
jgi:ribosomal protein L11 methyltransferase